MMPTPGPWQLHSDGLSVFGTGPNRQQVADLAICSPNLPTSEMFANARLVAAAPELVGCCRELLAVIDRHFDQDSLAAVVARMRDVIAKVDGRPEAAPLASGQPCGCDQAAGWTCERHRDQAVTP